MGVSPILTGPAVPSGVAGLLDASCRHGAGQQQAWGWDKGQQESETPHSSQKASAAAGGKPSADLLWLGSKWDRAWLQQVWWEASSTMDAGAQEQQQEPAAASALTPTPTPGSGRKTRLLLQQQQQHHMGTSRPAPTHYYCGGAGSCATRAASPTPWTRYSRWRTAGTPSLGACSTTR